MKYADLIPKVQQILQQYTMKLTLRQIYYRLVALHNYPNKRSSYNQLSSQLVRAREQGDIGENRIEDRTRSFIGNYTFSALTPKGVKRFIHALGGWQDNSTFAEETKDFFLNFWQTYERDMWQDQQNFVVVWVEKDALSRVLADAADKYRVITAPSRGYASFTYIRDAIRKFPVDKNIVVLHFSDHDSSGMDMTRDLRNRFDRYSNKVITVERVALTFDQVQEYDLSPNPTKTTDTRARDYIAEYGMECWELDAIEPDELQRLVKKSVENHVDLEEWKESLEQQEEEKAELEKTFQRWRDALDELDDTEEDED